MSDARTLDKHIIIVPKTTSNTFAIRAWASSGNICTPDIFAANMTKILIFGKPKTMTCKIHLIQIPEINKHFNGLIGLFTFKQGKSKDIHESLKEMKEQTIGQILSELGIQHTPPSIEYNYHHLNNFSHLAISVSHTKNLGSIVINSRNEYNSIGIDIELKSRTFNPRIKKFFVNEDDCYDDLLTLWTKKEAAFKACSPLAKNCKTLKDVIIQKNNFKFIGSSLINGIVQTTEQVIDGKTVFLSVAWTT